MFADKYGLNLVEKKRLPPVAGEEEEEKKEKTAEEKKQEEVKEKVKEVAGDKPAADGSA